MEGDRTDVPLEELLLHWRAASASLLKAASSPRFLGAADDLQAAYLLFESLPLHVRRSTEEEEATYARLHAHTRSLCQKIEEMISTQDMKGIMGLYNQAKSLLPEKEEKHDSIDDYIGSLGEGAADSLRETIGTWKEEVRYTGKPLDYIEKATKTAGRIIATKAETVTKGFKETLTRKLHKTHEQISPADHALLHIDEVANLYGDKVSARIGSALGYTPHGE